jgi:sterol desaturase/sphingolipid hydroxylase (fatty acid hydroxylase superfamily)
MEFRAKSRNPIRRSSRLASTLGGASTRSVLVVFALVFTGLPALFLLTGLAALFSTLLGLTALLALAGLARLSTLLFVFLHIVCHERFLHSAVHGFPQAAIFLSN